MITLDRLQSIIPPDQALANKALATSLQQVGGISNLTLPQFSATVASLQTTRDLPQITALTSAVPPSIANYYTSSLGTGTGPDNTILITDILGTAGGFVMTPALVRTLSILNSIDTTDLLAIYTVMDEVVNGDYGDPVTGPVVIPSGPYAGTYTDANDVFSNQLIPAAQSEISSLASVYPTQTAELNQLWDSMAGKLVLEFSLQAQANLVFANLTANEKNSIYGLIYSLPSYGLDTAQGSVTELLEAVCDLTTFTGQSITAALRQARNQATLGNSGILVSDKIPSDPATPPPQADLLPSEFTEQEATNLVIR